MPNPGRHMGGNALPHCIDTVRRFNRFYTKQIGVLQEHLLESPFSLTEARVIYELAHHDHTTARDLGAELGLDAGYLSRMLRGFHRRGLVQAKRSTIDGRETLLRLTARGQTAFAKLNGESGAEVGAMLRQLPEAAQTRLVNAMQTIEGLLREPPASPSDVPYILRPPRPGDMGWVVQRHGELYAQEYGCVFLVQKTRTVAQLRLLLVDPKTRGLGIGARLVDECTRFARQTGYRKIMLWTNSVLHAARRIYEHAGYTLVEEEKHHSFGHDLMGQTWELTL